MDTYVNTIGFVGSFNVGKSSIISRYNDKKFNNNTSNTIGVDFNQVFDKLDDKDIRINIWDVSGNIRYRSILHCYLRNCNNLVVVYDINDKNSKEYIMDWIKFCNEFIKDNCEIILVGNKTDIGKEVPMNLDMNLKTFKVSAKNGNNINELFNYLKSKTKRMIKKNSIKKVKLKDNIKRECCGISMCI